MRSLDVPGAAEAGVLYLRSLADAKQLRAAAEGARSAVVIGGGFISMEVAAVLAQRGLDTTLVFPRQRVWERFFTPDVYAAGDVANYFDVLYGRQRRIEHWDNAVEQGKHAARLDGRPRALRPRPLLLLGCL